MTDYTSALSESLVTLDSYSAVMPNWLTVTSEALTTDDTLGHQYTAVRGLTDATGASTLGVVNLPLLFTYLPPGSGTDISARMVQGYRSTAETLTAADSLGDVQHPTRPLSETLIASDSLSLQQIIRRITSDNVPLGVDSVVKRLTYARRLLDQVGNDKSISPMLLFPAPNNDVVTRIAGHPRLLSDTLHINDIIIGHHGAVRAITDPLTTSETFRRLLGIHRSLSDTLSPSQAITRLPAFSRTTVDTYHLAELLARHTTMVRLPSDTLSPSQGIAIISLKPRSLSEHLTTTDAITLEQILQAIMGYIWTAGDGSVVANMPDWGWVLVEDPVNGNSMNAIPISTLMLDPTREK